MPTTLATCEVYGTIYDVFGQSVAGAVVGCMSVYKNGALVLARTKEVTTDADGYFTMDLPRGPNSVAVLYANTPGLNISALGTPTAIPDADSAELTTIIGDFDLWNEVPVVIPGAGIGASIQGATPQSILFVDAAGALAQDPPKFMYDGAGVVLPADPTLPMHAATRQYVDAHGAAPAGTGTELQYRASPTALGAVAGSAVATNSVRWQGGLFLTGSSDLAMQDAGGGGVFFSVVNQSNTSLRTSVFYALSSGGNIGIVYFGRGGFMGNPSQSARQMSWYTSPDGMGDTRRMYMGVNGGVTIGNAPAGEGGAALALFPGAFAKALIVNGIGEMSADPTTPLGIATKQFVEAHGGAAPAGTGTELQYRASASAFGAIAGSSVSGSAVTVASRLVVAADPAQAEPTHLHIQVGAPNNTAALAVEAATGSGLLPCMIFAAIHQAGTPGVIYFGRNNWLSTQSSAVQMSFWTSPDGSSAVRRIHIGGDGSVFVNPGSTTANGHALTVYSGNGLASAMQINGAVDVTSGALTLAAGVAINGTFANGYTPIILQHNPSSTGWTVVGPQTSADNNNDGYLGTLMFCVGTGFWPGLGSAIASMSGGWTFNANMNVYGSLTLSNNTSNGLTGPNSLTLAAGNALKLGANVQLQTLNNAGAVVPTIQLVQNAGGDNLYIGGQSNIGYTWILGGQGLDGSPGSVQIHGPLGHWGFYAHIKMAAGYTICPYDAGSNSNPPMKIGPAGSGPGGTGRALYVD